MLTGDGILRRFQLRDGDWQAASKADAPLGVAEDAQMIGNFDGDGDLVPDALEWLAGTDPYNAASVTKLPAKWTQTTPKILQPLSVSMYRLRPAPAGPGPGSYSGGGEKKNRA